MSDCYCESERLIIRPIEWDDLDPLTVVHADPRMWRFFPSPFDRDYTAALIERTIKAAETNGFSFGAAVEKSTGKVIGYVGLHRVVFEAPFTPAVEIGWRVAVSRWGRGYASEAARRLLAWGFDDLKLDEILSFAVPANTASTRVMERIGMTRDADGDFEHPLLPGDSPLRKHVLYRISSGDWRRRTGGLSATGQSVGA